MKSNALVVLCLLVRVTHSFISAPYISLKATGRSSSPMTAVSMKIDAPHEGIDFLRRKASDAVALVLATSLVVSLGLTPAQTLAEELPAGTNPFNSICLGFGCGEYQGLEYGGAPAPTDEDSIPFKTFLESLDKGLVAKVDFESGGNKAYAFLKPEGGEGEAKRIRVGEGYPEEQSKGWSSPLWVVRALRDRQVPYTLGYDLGKGKTTDTVPK